MNIALDAMGGDHAPSEIVAGAVKAAQIYDDIEISLVGKPDIIQAELAKCKAKPKNISVVSASEVIEMDDKPAQAIRSKRDSSMNVASRLVREGKAQAFVTAGNTGGALAAGILNIGRIKGIHRPALLVPFPTHKGFCTLLDVGANADVRAEYMPQFAIMGSIYAKRIMGVESPSVCILSNGEEAGKGNQLVLDAFDLLEQTPGINFKGNVESKEVVHGNVDVVVTDGFTGNIFLKTAEGAATFVKDLITEELKATPVGMAAGLLALPAFKRVRKRIDDSEWGGAILLGLSGTVVVAHGHSNATTICHAIRLAKQSIEQNISDEIHADILSNR